MVMATAMTTTMMMLELNLTALPPGKELQEVGLGVLLQIMMLVLSFVLDHVLRHHKFYYLTKASASLLIGLIVLLIGGSTGHMLEALEVVGDGHDGPHGESFQGNNGNIAPHYEEGSSSGSGLKSRLKEFGTPSFTALDKNYLTPFFTTQNGDEEEPDEPTPNSRRTGGFRGRG